MDRITPGADLGFYNTYAGLYDWHSGEHGEAAVSREP